MRRIVQNALLWMHFIDSIFMNAFHWFNFYECISAYGWKLFLVTSQRYVTVSCVGWLVQNKSLISWEQISHSKLSNHWLNFYECISLLAFFLNVIQMLLVISNQPTQNSANDTIRLFSFFISFSCFHQQKKW